MSKENNVAIKFAKQLQNLALATNHCPECRQQIIKELSNRETEISGLCIPCQDLYFGGSNDE